MTTHLWFPQAAAVPSPTDLAAYLLQQGWSLESANVSWAVYSKAVGTEKVMLEVPQQAAAPDYGRAVGLLLEDIARLEKREVSNLLRDVRSSSVDVVRLAIEGSSTRDGRIPVEAGRRVYQAARDLMLAAACSVIDPRPVFAKRKPEEAMSFISRAKFGQTEIGSFVLTMECSIPPRLQQTLLGGDGDPDAPFDRKTCVRLAHALYAAEGATRESAASGKIEPFRQRAKDGVSANLCAAIAEVLDATSADTLRASFSFAPNRPIAELFQTTPQNVTLHLKAIYDEGELVAAATCKDYLQVRREGPRDVTRTLHHYRLNAILAVGFRVRSARGTQFRQWATERLSEYLVKGFTMDDERLKNPPGAGHQDYFDELLARIRDIRSSERRFYQKVLDIYATSVDYEPDAELSQQFFATVQNKMHWATHGHTAAEIVHERADATKPLMGLQTTRPGGIVRKEDAAVAKNYLTEHELQVLNRIVALYIEYAELQALERKPMSMQDWVTKLDDFLKASGRKVLANGSETKRERPHDRIFY